MKLLAEYAVTEQHALRNEVCPEATDDQINYFLRVCNAKGVDPFSGLLYMQLRKNSRTGKFKAGISATIDGSRTAAARTGFYAGSDEPEFDSEENKFPKWCRVTVHRMVKGERCAFSAKCRWEEFKPSAPNDFQWNSKPYHMLAKVTEMQALRKAFPELVSGANEDDYEAESDAVSTDLPPAVNPAEWMNAVKAFGALGILEAGLLAKIGVTSSTEATPEHMDQLRIWYDELNRAKQEFPA